MTEAPTEDHATTNGSGPHADDASSGGSLIDALPTERLKDAAQALLKAATDRAVGAALDQIDGLTGRLGDVAENGGVGLSQALLGGGSEDEDEDGDDSGGGLTGALKNGLSTVKDTVGGALGLGSGGSGGSGGGSNTGARGKFKFMNIYEAQDVGVPLRVAYDQWTQFADFPSFMKKVENVDQSSDEKITWKAQVFWSHRTWETTIVEQVPDSHILWTSSGAKGRADGYVSFSELAPNLTKIVMILEYYPQGFFEKTANIWRAVGRRARLEFKHFCRHVMMDTLVNRDDLEGWRGEIRDSEVVKTHEEALEEEEAAAAQDDAEGELDEADEADEARDDEFDGDLDPDDPDADDGFDDEPVADDDRRDAPEDGLDDDPDDPEDEFEDELDDERAPADEEPSDGERESRRPRRQRRTQPA